MLIDNWFLDSAEGTLILFIRRKWSNCYDYHFDNKSSFPGIDIIFNLSDHLKSHDFQSRCHNTFMALHQRRNRYEYDKFVWPFV